MVRILVVDDESKLTQSVCAYLNDSGYEAKGCLSAESAYDAMYSQLYDLIISDIMMPGTDGFEFAKTVRGLNKTIPILFMSARDDLSAKQKGFDLGIDDYMVKPFDFRELNARIKVLLKRVSGNVPELPQELVYADLRIDLQRKDVERNNVPIKLSPKEYNLLLYMVENAERVLSRVEIAEKVWNTHFDTGTNFIDVYINYLRKKIDRNFEPKLIHTKAGMGFILTDKL